jgi:hypothetical protein
MKRIELCSVDSEIILKPEGYNIKYIAHCIYPKGINCSYMKV